MINVDCQLVLLLNSKIYVVKETSFFYENIHDSGKILRYTLTRNAWFLENDECPQPMGKRLVML
jgi:hypothetical protein